MDIAIWVLGVVAIALAWAPWSGITRAAREIWLTWQGKSRNVPSGRE